MKPVETDEFFCNCSDAGKARCDEARETAERLLGKSISDPPMPLLERLLYALSIDSHMGVNIVADQWCGVSVSYYNTHDKSEARTMFQCDDILDGLCGAYLWLQDREAHEGVTP